MDEYQASFPIGPDEPAFAGHFPGRPILPGVFTLALVRETLRLGTGHAWRLVGIDRHKLLRPILPGAAVAVHCRVAGRDGATLSLICRLTLADGTEAASARLRLEPVCCVAVPCCRLRPVPWRPAGPFA
jgi:3-hydroxyacyl-[acyl-carrier-protein] dehydratase